MNERVQGMLLGSGICALLLGAQALLSDAPTAPAVEPSVIARMLPDDLGQKSVIWLEPNKDGGLTLNYEKHQVISYGMASVPVSVK